MRRWTPTRFVDQTPVGHHDGSHPYTGWGPDRRHLLAGQPVRIVLPPRPPSAFWTCGTEWEWEIHPDDYARLGGNPNPYGTCVVCQHAVELD